MPTASALAAWATVSGGLVLLGIWLASGGARAEEPGPGPQLRSGLRSRFRLAHVLAHATLGVLVAVLLTAFAADRFDPAFRGAAVTLGFLAVAVALGLALARSWLTGRRVGEDTPEQRLPSAVVAAHGLAAAATTVLLIAALVQQS